MRRWLELGELLFVMSHLADRLSAYKYPCIAQRRCFSYLKEQQNQPISHHHNQQVKIKGNDDSTDGEDILCTGTKVSRTRTEDLIHPDILLIFNVNATFGPCFGNLDYYAAVKPETASRLEIVITIHDLLSSIRGSRGFQSGAV